MEGRNPVSAESFAMKQEFGFRYLGALRQDGDSVYLMLSTSDRGNDDET